MTFLENDDGEIFDEDFSIAVDDMHIACESTIFNCDFCSKVYKTKGGLTRHVQAKHTSSSSNNDDAEMEIDFTMLRTVIELSIVTLSEDLCLTSQRRSSFKSFVICENELLPLLNELNIIHRQFKVTNNAEEFFSSYFSKCVFKSGDFFKNLPQPSSTFLATKVGENIMAELKRKNTDVILKSDPPPITDREVDALQYLAGYVVKKILKKAKCHSNYSSAENQSVISILENAITKDDIEQKLIHSINRGGLTVVTDDCQKKIYRTEERFRVETHVDHLRKIDIKKMSTDLIKDVDIVSYFNLLVDETDKRLTIEIQQNLLQSMIALYLRVRSFSLAKDITTKQKNIVSSSKSLRKDLKKKSIEKTL